MPAPAPASPPRAPRQAPSATLRVGWLSDSGSPAPGWLATGLAADSIQLRPWTLEPIAPTAVAGLLLWLDQATDAALPLVRSLRQQGPAALLVLSGPCAPELLRQTVTAGADLHLLRPLAAEQILLGLRAVWQARPPQPVATSPWTLLDPSGLLVSPDGTVLALDAAELSLLRQLASGPAQRASTAALAKACGGDPDQAAALLYRLRRRIEREAQGHRLLVHGDGGDWCLSDTVLLRPD